MNEPALRVDDFQTLLDQVWRATTKPSLDVVYFCNSDIPWLIQQGLRHLKFGEFSVITGYPGYILWRTGILSLLKKVFGK